MIMENYRRITQHIRFAYEEKKNENLMKKKNNKTLLRKVGASTTFCL